MVKAASEFEPDIVALADRLREVPVGGVIKYAELDAVIGRDVRARRYLLMQARDRVEEETGALFQAVFNLGLKRLKVEAFPTIGQAGRKSIRSKAATATKRMQNGLAKANDVPDTVLRAVNREASVLGLIRFAARDRVVSKMLEGEPLSAPTPIARAAKDLMAAMGIKLED